jgi:hypothetical protein
VRQIVKAELLRAMKECLHDLENTALLSPDDLDIIAQKRFLRQQIAELETEGDNVQIAARLAAK